MVHDIFLILLKHATNSPTKAINDYSCVKMKVMHGIPKSGWQVLSLKCQNDA